MFIKIDKIIAHLEEMLIATGLLLAATILFINVILRYFFHSGFVWAEELTLYMIIWITFIGASVGVRRRAHLGVTALVDALPALPQRIVAMSAYLFSVAFTGFLFIYGSLQTLAVRATHQLSSAMEIPVYWIYMAIAVGGFLMTVRFIQVMVSDLRAGTACAQKNYKGGDLG
jgi:C4-dicarboxylate transporter DctQ subunit